MRASHSLKPALVSLMLCLACRAQETKTASAGDLRIELAIEPDPPVAGDNTLRVSLHDAAGRPVAGARLTVGYDMPAMGSMPEMRGDGATKDLGSGRYALTYALPMLGDWTVTLQVEAAGHPGATLHLRVSPPRKGFTLESGSRNSPVREAPRPEAGSLSREAGSPKELDLTPERLQLIGVTFATVEPRPLAVAMRAAGHVEVDERNLIDVNLKYEAYVRKLYVGETGARVKKGEPLLTLYSPELLAAEEELLQVRRSAHEAAGAELVRAATRRLRLWDLSLAQLAALEERGTADGIVVVHAPATGVVLDKPVVEGMHAMPGTTLYRLGNLGRVWVEAEFYEFDAPFLAVGEPATVSLPALEGAQFSGRVSFVAPTLDEKTRTLRGRIELANPGRLLKPGMFADVRADRPLGKLLSVTDSALLLSGSHRYAFIDRGEGRLLPVEVQVGAQAGDYDEVTSGLSAGDRVVLGGNFLVSSEAQLRDALPRWSAP